MKHLLIIVLLVVFVSGCVEQQKTVDSNAQQTGSNNLAGTNSKDLISDASDISGTQNVQNQLTKLARNYYRYDPEAYQKASEAGKIIFLDFHANWCPICRSEHPEIVAAFNELNYDDVIGFQVHYNDDETMGFDTEIARQFQVPYQHTKIFLDKKGNLIEKTLSELDKEMIKNILEEARSA